MAITPGDYTELLLVIMPTGYMDMLMVVLML